MDCTIPKNDSEEIKEIDVSTHFYGILPIQ